MKRFKFLAVFLVLFPLTSVFAHGGHSHDNSRPQDQAAIKRLVRDFSKAWGRNDVSALSNFWTEDGDLINPAGREAHGRSEVYNLLADEHGGALRGTRMAIQVEQIRFLTHAHALVDTKSVLSGMKMHDGKKHPDFKHHFTFVATKTPTGWRFLSARPYAFVGDVAPAMGSHMCPKDGGKECCKDMH